MSDWYLVGVAIFVCVACVHGCERPAASGIRIQLDQALVKHVEELHQPTALEKSILAVTVPLPPAGESSMIVAHCHVAFIGSRL
jgi:hypothetical protein